MILDYIKLVVAAALAVLGLVGYYFLSDNALVFRVLSVAGGLLLGGLLARFTGPGRVVAAFARESIVEVKKVVWPTRKETLQTTGVVFLFVIAMALFLFISDKTLEWALYDLILGWTKN